jgi:hypothetical protein
MPRSLPPPRLCPQFACFFSGFISILPHVLAGEQAARQHPEHHAHHGAIEQLRRLCSGGAKQSPRMQRARALPPCSPHTSSGLGDHEPGDGAVGAGCAGAAAAVRRRAPKDGRGVGAAADKAAGLSSCVAFVVGCMLFRPLLCSDCKRGHERAPAASCVSARRMCAQRGDFDSASSQNIEQTLINIESDTVGDQALRPSRCHAAPPCINRTTKVIIESCARKRGARRGGG